ncbi:RluA family pseudouridine synthase [Desulfobulbus elongatus]|uniref:RluA family pseudouridine synthase n=1 Tax=Desulfobulbus elongatus TaxID=53332 RepID=UPI000685ED83|nr:RluA family pseudouridine synthase [Desulfobulbus elongatus]
MTGPEKNGAPAPDGGDPAASAAVFVTTPADAGQRLDHFLTGTYPEYTRSALNKLIGTSHVLVDGRRVKAGHRLRTNETVTVVLPPPSLPELTPEQIDFTVLYEDAHLLVISKPPGLVVHPAGGHRSGTLVHGLLHLCRELPAADAGRPGIVHRLDKDTSGVMLVAKTEIALRSLMADFKDRRIRKTYHALLVRCPKENEGRVVAPIGRHPVDRKKMAVRPVHGKYAATNWRVLERFANGWCWAEIGIETGRTHQIRVHMASIKAPVAGDTLYGGAVDRRAAIRPRRQMLHASTLRFRHPVTGEAFCCTAPLAEDMQAVLTALREAGT